MKISSSLYETILPMVCRFPFTLYSAISSHPPVCLAGQDPSREVCTDPACSPQACTDRPPFGARSQIKVRDLSAIATSIAPADYASWHDVRTELMSEAKSGLKARVEAELSAAVNDEELKVLRDRFSAEERAMEHSIGALASCLARIVVHRPHRPHARLLRRAQRWPGPAPASRSPFASCTHLPHLPHPPAPPASRSPFASRPSRLTASPPRARLLRRARAASPPHRLALAFCVPLNTAYPSTRSPFASRPNCPVLSSQFAVLSSQFSRAQTTPCTNSPRRSTWSTTSSRSKLADCAPRRLRASK